MKKLIKEYLTPDVQSSLQDLQECKIALENLIK
jgi:hypothetical protein